MRDWIPAALDEPVIRHSMKATRGSLGILDCKQQLAVCWMEGVGGTGAKRSIQARIEASCYSGWLEASIGRSVIGRLRQLTVRAGPRREWVGGFLGHRPDQPLHVIGEIGKADLGSGAGDLDGADEQSHRPFLSGKDISTTARTTDWRALALAVRRGIGLPLGFLRWIRERGRRPVRKYLLALRWAVSAHISPAVLLLPPIAAELA